jgi:hypothetical protein
MPGLSEAGRLTCAFAHHYYIQSCERCFARRSCGEYKRMHPENANLPAPEPVEKKNHGLQIRDETE